MYQSLMQFIYTSHILLLTQWGAGEGGKNLPVWLFSKPSLSGLVPMHVSELDSVRLYDSHTLVDSGLTSPEQLPVIKMYFAWAAS